MAVVGSPASSTIEYEFLLALKFSLFFSLTPWIPVSTDESVVGFLNFWNINLDAWWCDIYSKEREKKMFEYEKKNFYLVKMWAKEWNLIPLQILDK